MKKVFFSTCFLLLSLEARENPFFPSAGEKDLLSSANENISLPKLQSASLTLPLDARIIKKVTIEYENLDALAARKIIELNHTIDSNLPVFISQSYSKDAACTPKVSKKTLAKKVVQKYKEVARMKYASFFILEDTLKIVSSDELIRNFLLAKPHRIVLDFKKNSRLRTYIKEIDKSIFTKIRIGDHKGYYRVVIELNGHHGYDLKKQADGYSITLQ